MAEGAVEHAEAEVRKALATIQHTATEVANTPTLGLYYVREHVRASLPLVVASRQELAGAQDGLQDGLYAARGGEEFGATLRAVLPGALERLQESLARATATAAAATSGSRPTSTLARSMDRLGLRGGAPHAASTPAAHLV